MSYSLKYKSCTLSIPQAFYLTHNVSVFWPLSGCDQVAYRIHTVWEFILHFNTFPIKKMPYSTCNKISEAHSGKSGEAEVKTL